MFRATWKKLLNEDQATPEKLMDLFYMKILRIYMRLNASWPHKVLGERVPFFANFLSVLLVVQSSLILPLQILYMKHNNKHLTFTQKGHTYLTILLTLLGINRQAMIFRKSYGVVAKEFITEIHLFYYQNKSEFAKKIFATTTKISAVFTAFIVMQLYSGATLFNVTPIVNNYRDGMFKAEKPVNGTYHHSVYYYLPKFVDPYTNPRSYSIMVLFNQYMSYFCIGSMSSSELFLTLMIINVVGHLKILRNELETFPRPGHFGLGESSGITYNGDELPVVEDKLKELVDYHRMLLGFAERMTDSYSSMLFFYYMFHQVSGCLLLFLVSPLDYEAITVYFPLTLFMFQQLIQLSVIFEYMGTESDRLVSSVYSLPWESMDVGSMKTVQIFLRQVQRPIELKAAGVAHVGCTSMAAILKTTFTYFTLLRSLPE